MTVHTLSCGLIDSVGFMTIEEGLNSRSCLNFKCHVLSITPYSSVQALNIKINNNLVQLENIDLKGNNPSRKQENVAESSYKHCCFLDAQP